MNSSQGKSSYYPFISYFLLIAIIVLSNKFLSYEYVLSISASTMLLIPMLLKRDDNLFSVTCKGLLNGILISIAVVCIYAVIVYLLPLSFGNNLNFEKVTFSLVFINFFLVAIPEEFFFRGYLQKQLGNNIKAIILVSLMFALAHFTTICVFKGGSVFVCSVNILTFFPSLVMGYLYYKTKTIWSSVFFHFVANIAHVVVLSG